MQFMTNGGAMLAPSSGRGLQTVINVDSFQTLLRPAMTLSGENMQENVRIQATAVADNEAAGKTLIGQQLG